MNTSPTPFSSYQKLIIAVLALAQFVVILDFMIISPIGDILIKSLNISTQEFGWVVSAYIFSAALSGFLAAGFLDQFDRKKTLIFFFTGFIIGTLFCALANSYWTLLLARVVAGIFGGVVGSVAITIVSDLFAASQRGQALGLLQMAFAASQILGIPLGIWIADWLDWHYSFLFIVLLSLPILGIVFWKMQPLNAHLQSPRERKAFAHLWHTLGNRRHQVGFIAMVFLAAGMMLQPFVSIFLVNNVQIPNNQLPLVFMLTGASSLLVMPWIGRLADRIDKFKVFFWGSLGVMILIPLYTQLPVVPLWVVIMLNMATSTAITSRMTPFQALNSMVPLPADRGAYLSVSTSLQQVSSGAGVLVASSIAFQATPTSPLENFDVLGYVIVILSLIALYLVYRMNVMVR